MLRNLFSVRAISSVSIASSQFNPHLFSAVGSHDIFGLPMRRLASILISSTTWLLFHCSFTIHGLAKKRVVVAVCVQVYVEEVSDRFI